MSHSKPSIVLPPSDAMTPDARALAEGAFAIGDGQSPAADRDAVAVRAYVEGAIVAFLLDPPCNAYHAGCLAMLLEIHREALRLPPDQHTERATDILQTIGLGLTPAAGRG